MIKKVLINFLKGRIGYRNLSKNFLSKFDKMRVRYSTDGKGKLSQTTLDQYNACTSLSNVLTDQ